MNEDGHSFVEAIIAIGLVAAAALAVMEVTTQSSRSNKTQSLNADFNNLSASVGRVLKNRQACSFSLQNLDWTPATGGGAVPVAQLGLSGGTVAQVSTANPGLQVTGMRFDTVHQDLGVIPECGLHGYLANFHLDALRVGSSGPALSQAPLTMDYKVAVYTNPATNRVIACGSPACCAPVGKFCTANSDCCSGVCTGAVPPAGKPANTCDVKPCIPICNPWSHPCGSNFLNDCGVNCPMTGLAGCIPPPPPPPVPPPPVVNPPPGPAPPGCVPACNPARGCGSTDDGCNTQTCPPGPCLCNVGGACVGGGVICMTPGQSINLPITVHYNQFFQMSARWPDPLPAAGWGDVLPGGRIGYILLSDPFHCNIVGGANAVGSQIVLNKICNESFENDVTGPTTGTATFTLTADAGATPGPQIYNFGVLCNQPGCAWDEADIQVQVVCP